MARPALDWLALPVAATWWLWPAATLPLQGGAGALMGSLAQVMGLLAAVVTFACSALYQERTPAVQRLRRDFGPSVRRAWIGAILTLVVGAAVSLAAQAIVGIDLTLALALGSAALLAGLMKTLRAVAWLSRVLGAADKAAAVGPAPEVRQIA